jgi:hypothetical protein
MCFVHLACSQRQDLQEQEMTRIIQFFCAQVGAFVNNLKVLIVRKLRSFYRRRYGVWLMIVYMLEIKNSTLKQKRLRKQISQFQECLIAYINQRNLQTQMEWKPPSTRMSWRLVASGNSSLLLNAWVVATKACKMLKTIRTANWISHCTPTPHKTMVANPRKMVEIQAPLTTPGLHITHMVNSQYMV